ncbi:hypothetical protein F0562_025702 [Nyssa sinensis]|uniref:ALOG domain-containing protein n=1 Tax=Nyssa sinensis TaxID=561372 RepID=A0A5J5B979_9ASTE|nr:hypothetical protein F0562_025702 [Nyssa sinensis]
MADLSLSCKLPSATKATRLHTLYLSLQYITSLPLFLERKPDNLIFSSVTTIHRNCIFPRSLIALYSSKENPQKEERRESSKKIKTLEKKTKRTFRSLLPWIFGAHVLEFLRYLDQFGKTKVHNQTCPFFGVPNPPAPCPCPLRQAWGSLDSLIGRLRAAYEEHGGKPEANPFGARAVRLFLREVREFQAKSRGISYEKKRKRAKQKVAQQQPHVETYSGKANIE